MLPSNSGEEKGGRQGVGSEEARSWKDSTVGFQSAPGGGPAPAWENLARI